MITIKTLFTGKKQLFVTVLLLLIVGFTLLSLFVIYGPPSYLDLHVSEEIQERNSSGVDVFMKAVSWFGYFPASLIVTVIVACLFYLFRLKREAVFTLFTLISGIVSALLKMLINRSRPSKELVRIIEIAKEQSFPSGHVQFYTVFFGLLIIIMLNQNTLPRFLRVSITLVSILLIILVPISRVYIGAHWFTDVLGGFISGMICLMVLGYYYLFGKVKKREKNLRVQ